MTALTFAAASAHANDHCAPIVLGPAHSSADEAAIAALRSLLMAGHPYESGGFIVKAGAKFRASKPVTQRSRTRVSYCIVVPRGSQLAGLYHTHVRLGEFSPKDRANAERSGVPSFLGTLSDGALYVYEPGSAKARTLGKPFAEDPQTLVAAAGAERAWHERLLAATRTLWASIRRTWERFET